MDPINWIKYATQKNKLIDDDLRKEMINVVSSKSRFDRLVNTTTTHFVLNIVEPTLLSMFDKYSEPYFHQRMSEGFNFISDWKINHRYQYAFFIKTAKKMNNRMEINAEMMYKIIMKIKDRKGWTLYDWEKERVRIEVNDLVSEIYS